MKTLGLSSLLFSGLAAVVSACGPWLPSLLLTEDKQAALRSPKAELITELQHLPALPKLPRGIQPHDFDREEYAHLREGDLVINKDEDTDVAAALIYYQVPPEHRESVTAGYARMRRAMEQIRKPVLERRELQKDVADILFAMPLPVEIPPELAEYLQGAIAFHCGEEDTARAIWSGLLTRPAAERHFRSTWAAYMLGRMAAWDADDDEAKRGEAIRWMQRVREVVQEGCEDRMGLVGLSYYWEAQLQPPGHSENEAQLAALSFLSGCVWSASWLRGIGDDILDTEDDSVRVHAARIPLLRQLATVSALVAFEPPASWSGTEEMGKRTEKLSRWLEAVEKASVRNVEEADRVAWAFYDAGNFHAAAAWLRKAPADAPVALWLRGKLALRAGRNTEAAHHFADAARHLPAPVPAIYPRQGWWWYDPATAYPLTPEQQLQADLGITQLARAHFTEALDALLHTGAWLDAAYVAEQVLTSKELLAYLHQHPELAAAPTVPPPDNQTDPPPYAGLHQGVPQTFRYLLARRLAREGRLREARLYMPQPLLARFDEYRHNLAGGHDRSLPAEERSEALWQAARIHRYLGMELFGSETAPDWTFYDGAFECDDIGGLRAGVWKPNWGDPRFTKTTWLPRISPLEIARNARLRPTPNARFHYRYIAADLAWQAAKLRPPDEQTARMLCIAGGWLKDRDPQSADRFYQELVGRCGKTALGREGEHRRWFPPVNDEPFESPLLN